MVGGVESLAKSDQDVVLVLLGMVRLFCLAEDLLALLLLHFFARAYGSIDVRRGDLLGRFQNLRCV